MTRTTEASVTEGPGPTATLSRWARSFVTFSRSFWGGLLLLLAADIILGLAVLGPIIGGKTPIITGDLAGIYVYSPQNPVWFTELRLYSVLEVTLSWVLPLSLAHNLLYAATFFLPSIGIYLLLDLFSRSRLATLSVAFSVGTIANPILAAGFAGGAPEYGLWIFFSLLGLRLLWTGFRSSGRWETVAAAGLCFAIASLQTLGLSGMAVGGPLLTGSLLILFASYLVISGSKILEDLKSRLGLTAILFATYVTGLVPVLAAALSISANILGTSVQANLVHSYVLPTVTYTFAPYSGFAAFVGAVPTPGPNGYEAVLNPIWATISILCVVSGFARFADRSDPLRWVAGIFASYYLLNVGILIMGALGVLNQAFVSIPPLDLLDSPVFFLYTFVISIPFLLLSFFEYLLPKVPILPLHAGIRESSAPTAEPWRELPDRSVIVYVTGIRPRHNLIVGLASAILVVVVVSASVSSQGTIENNLSKNATLEGGSPFAPLGLQVLQEWYSGATVTGKVLVLPDDYLTVNAAESYLPSSALWTVPLLASQENSGYNASAFAVVLDSLASRDATTFAFQLAASGVQFVALLHTSDTITLIPSYVVGSASSNYSAVRGTLANSSEFTLSKQYGILDVFLDLEYHGPSSSITSLLTIEPLLGSPTIESEGVLTGSNFTAWTAYLSTSVHLVGNLVAEVSVNSSASIPYVVYYADLPPMVFGDQSPGGGVTFDTVYTTIRYSFYDNFTIAPGVSLTVSVYWYNATNPTNFFGEFAGTAVGTFTDTNHSFGLSFSVPSGAVFGRLVYDFSATESDINATSTIDFPSLVRTEQASAVWLSGQAATNATLELLNRSLIGGPLLLIGPPFNQGMTMSNAPGTTVLALASASAIERNGVSSINFSLVPSSTTDQFVNTHWSSGYAFVDGEVSKARSLNVHICSSTNCTTDVLGSGAFVSLVPLPTGELTSNITGQITGNGTLGLAGEILLPNSASTVGLNRSVLAPVGSLQIAYSTGGYRVTWIFPGSSQEGSGILGDVVSVLPLALLVSLLIAICLRSGRRLGKWAS